MHWMRGFEVVSFVLIVCAFVAGVTGIIAGQSKWSAPLAIILIFIGLFFTVAWRG